MWLVSPLLVGVGLLLVWLFLVVIHASPSLTQHLADLRDLQLWAFLPQLGVGVSDFRFVWCCKKKKNGGDTRNKTNERTSRARGVRRLEVGNAEYDFKSNTCTCLIRGRQKNVLMHGIPVKQDSRSALAPRRSGRRCIHTYGILLI